MKLCYNKEKGKEGEIINGYGYDVVGYSTVGTYTEHTDNIMTAYEKFRGFMEWANRVEIVDLELAEVFEEWERE